MDEPPVQEKVCNFFKLMMYFNTLTSSKNLHIMDGLDVHYITLF